MPRTREKFSLMKSRRDNGQGSDSLTEEDNENDREGLDESKQKRCLSKKEVAYLVAFIVSDFVSVTGQTKSGLQVRSNEVPSQYMLFHTFCYIDLDLSLVKS